MRKVLPGPAVLDGDAQDALHEMKAGSRALAHARARLYRPADRRKTYMLARALHTQGSVIGSAV